MSITKGGDNKLVYTPITDFDRFGLTGVMRHDSFAICADKDQLKQIQFDPSDQATNTIVLFKSGANSSSITLTLPTTSGTLVTSAGIGSSFTTMQTDMGTFPVATSPTDTLTLTSSDGSVNITGDSATDTVDFVVDTTAIAANFWSVGGNTTGGNRILGSLDSFDWDIVANNVPLIRLNNAQSSISISSNSALPTFVDLPLNVNRAIGIEGNGLELANIRFEIGGGGSDPASPTDGVVLYYSEDHGNRLFNLKRTDGTKVAFSFQDPVSDAAANFPATLSGTDDLVFKNLAQDLLNKNLDSSTINNTAFQTGTIILGPSLVDAQFSGTGTTVVTTDSGGHLSPQAVLSGTLGGTGVSSSTYVPNGLMRWNNGAGQFANSSTLTFDTTTLIMAPNGLTGSAATTALDLSQNWNTSGTPTLIKANVTTGTANAASLILDLQYVAASQFKVGITGVVTAAAAGSYGFNGRSKISSSADGYLLLQNNAGTDFTGLRFGLTTAAAPMLKRNSTGIDFRLADDSGYAPIIASQIGVGMTPIATWGAVQILSSGLNGITITDSVSNSTAKQGVFTGAPFTSANSAWTGFGISDNGTFRRLWWGGGGWTRPDATSQQFFTAPTYTQSNNTGVLRFEIFADGHSAFKTAPVATANYGNVSVGAGAFDGSTSGFFVGSSSGTSIAINEISGYAGNLFDAQVAGAMKFRVSPAGLGNFASNLMVGSTSAPNASLEVVGTSAAPATSGSASFGGFRFGNPGAGVAFDMGFNGAVPVAWIQPRNSTSYASNFELSLNPNGGRVSIGSGAAAASVGVLSITDSVFAASGSLNDGIVNLIQTWNTTGTVTGIKYNVLTGTSNAASLLMDLQFTSTSQFKVSKAGTMTATGDLISSTAGKGLQIKEGSNAKMGVSTLVAGTVVVSTTAVTANSRIFLTGQNNAGTIGDLRVTARTAGTSFTISSTTALDVSDVAWILIEPS